MPITVDDGAPEDRCCDEPGCRRKQPIKLFRGGLTGRWMAATRWRWEGNSRLYAVEKHELTAEQSADLDAAFAALEATHNDGASDEAT